MRRPVVALIALAVLAPVLGSLLLVPIVSWRAGVVADGRPACIQVAIPDSAGYRPAASPLDLNAWRLWSTRHRRYGHSNFHAVLFVARPDGRFERFNWSYRSMDFRPIVGQGHVLLADRPDCTPS